MVAISTGFPSVSHTVPFSKLGIDCAIMLNDNDKLNKAKTIFIFIETINQFALLSNFYSFFHKAVAILNAINNKRLEIFAVDLQYIQSSMIGGYKSNKESFFSKI